MFKSRTWEVRWENDSDDSTTAVICEYYGNGRYYDIAEVRDIPCEPDESGDPTPIRNDAEAQRLREVLLLVCAPDMLKAMKKAIAELEEFTGLNGKFEDDKWPDVDTVWKHIKNIQTMLESVVDDSQDTERI
jgi:hypothetical protein